MKRKICEVLTICLIAASLSGCGQDQEEEQESKVVNVEVVNPSYDNISVDGSFIGTVETGETVSIFPKISAQVMAKYYEVGDYVNAGDLLFVLDDKALQIEKKNADASVQSAAAALSAQKANSAAVQAAANETIGTIATTEFEKAKAINEADREANAARISESKSMKQADYFNGDAERAQKQIRASENQYDSAQKYYKHLSEVRDTYVKLEKEKGEEQAGGYLKEKTNFLTYEELSAATDAAKGTMDTAGAEKVAQEGNYSSSIAQKIEACTNAEIERGNLANAQEAKALAQKMFMDYELFTKNTLLAEANARVVEGNANVAASDSLLQSAKAAQDMANLQLSYTTVTAPINGVIDEINIVQYGMANDQSAAYVITGQDSKKICFGVPESAKQKMEVGQEVTIKKDDKEYTAVVTRINDNLQQGSVLFKVEAAIRDLPEAEFVVGTKFKIITSVDNRKNVLTIPISSLYYDDGKPYIYVVQNGKSVRKDVETGLSNNSKIQIVSGLEENEQVITSWSSSLKDQTDIQIVSSNRSDSAGTTIKIEEADSSKSEKIDISRASAPEPVKEVVPETIKVETTDKVNIRKEADKQSSKLDTVAKGTVFEKISDTDNGWTKIKYNDQEGYIKSEYVKVIQ